MVSSSYLSTAPDALDPAGVLLLPVRAIDQRFCAETGMVGLTLAHVGVLGQIARRVDGPEDFSIVVLGEARLEV